MNHAKQLIVRPEIKRTGTLLKLSRKQLRIYVMFLTGHGIFKAHLHKMGIVSDKLCRFCNVKDETAEHLLGWCKRFDYERCILFGNRKLTLRRLSTFDFKDMILYLRTTHLVEKFIMFDLNNLKITSLSAVFNAAFC
jgi:hypothetical protein